MTIEITIQKDTENPFLERRDLEFTVTSDGATPKANDVRTALATKLKVPDKNILIEHIYQKMGLSESDCIAKVYKKSLVAEKEGEGSKESEPTGEVPVEEKKDDVKAEATTEGKKDAPASEKQPEKTEEQEKEVKEEDPAPEKTKEDTKE